MTRLYDALVYLGRDINLEPFQCSDMDSLSRTLDKYRIEKALVSSFTSVRLDVAYGNELTFTAAAHDERLVPCPVVLPNSGLEVGDETDYIDELIRRGARCACFYPNTCGTTLDRRVIGGLFKVLEKRRLPVALFETDIPNAASLAAEYPGVPFIIHGPSSRDRVLIPIIKSVPNLHISLMPGFSPYRGLEVLVEQCGAEKFLFASGYPQAEPGSPISYLLYSALNDTDVDKIAFGNLERLTNGVCIDSDTEVEKNAARVVVPNKQLRAPKRRVTGLCAYVWKREPLPWKGIMDMHGHYGKWFQFPVWGGEAEDMVAEMDRVGIEKVFVSHQAAMSTEVVYGNNKVLAGMARYPDRILGYAACYPVNDTLGIEEIRRCVESGMHGIKLHSYTGIPYTSEKYKSVWEYADQRKLPVLLHT